MGERGEGGRRPQQQRAPAREGMVDRGQGRAREGHQGPAEEVQLGARGPAPSYNGGALS